MAFDFRQPRALRLRIRIRAFIKENGLTQRRFAESVGCKPSQLSMFLTGKRSLEFRFMARARDVMGITFGDLDNEQETHLEVELLKGKLGQLFLENPSGFRLVNQTIDTLLTTSKAAKSRRGSETD